MAKYFVDATAVRHLLRDAIAVSAEHVLLAPREDLRT